MSKARNISNLFSGATDAATDAEVIAAIAAHNLPSNGHVNRGSTASLPVSATNGDLYYNTDEKFLQVYHNGAWYFYGIAAKDVTAISAINQGTGRAYNNGQMQVSYTPDTTGGVAKTTTIWSDPQQLSIVATGSPVTFTGLTSGVSHRFYALMTNNAVASNQGGELLSTGVIATTVPQAPQSLIATGADSSVSIAFSGGTGGSAITNYSYSTDGTNYTAFSPAQTSSPVTITGLTNGQAYTIYLKAINANGTSLASSGVSATAGSATSFESIATVTGNGSATSLSFTSIPSTYKHLQIRAIVKTNLAGNPSAMKVQFNGTTTGYFDHGLYGDGASTGAYGRTNVDTAGSSYIAGNGAANVYAAVIIDILDYTNTNKNKTFRTLSGADFNGSGQVRFSSGSLASTSAITSLTFEDANSAVAFYQYTSIALYGIKGA